MLPEKWKPLKHSQIHDGYYLSSYGRIRYEDNDPYEPTYHSSNGYDYSLFVLKNNEGDPSRHQRLFPIDDLIGITFIPISEELENKPIRINHIDNDLRNNHINNLEWVEDVEEWREVTYPGVKPGMYEVSSLGRVRNKDSRKVLTGSINCGNNKYHCFCLRTSETGLYTKNQKLFPVHRLIANEFIYKHDNQDIVNHINGIKVDNHYKNLEWVTMKENNDHSVLSGLWVPNFGEQSGSKVTRELAEQICKLLLKYDGSISRVVDEIDNEIVSYGIVSSIKYGTSWKWLSDKYFTRETFQRKCKRPLDDNMVHLICNLLLNKFDGQPIYVHRYILEKYNIDIPRRIIQEIKIKKTFRKISDMYFSRDDIMKKSLNKPYETYTEGDLNYGK